MKPLFVIFTLTILLPTFSVAQDKATKRTEYFNLQKGVAIKGYDPIVFFNNDRAVQANGTIVYEYNGVKYFFTSSKNLKQFKTTPSKFEPQYGGWCALNMSESGNRVEANPQYFTIHNGKLYFFSSVKNKYEWEKKSMESDGDNNWNSIMD